MPFSISPFGIVLAASYILGVFIFWRWGRREGFSSNDLFDLALVSSLVAVGGGKIPPILLGAPSEFFWAGAVLAGAIALLIFASFRRWSFLRLMDLGAVALGFSEAAAFLGFWILKIQPPIFLAGYAARMIFLYFIHRRLPSGITFFSYLILEGVLLYLSNGFLSLALGGAGIIGLIAILIKFKVKRSNG